MSMMDLIESAALSRNEDRMVVSSRCDELSAALRTASPTEGDDDDGITVATAAAVSPPLSSKSMNPVSRSSSSSIGSSRCASLCDR